MYSVNIIISSSAGELEYLYPYVRLLKSKGFAVDLFYLNDVARKSVEKNKTISENKEISRLKSVILFNKMIWIFIKKVDKFLMKSNSNKLKTIRRLSLNMALLILYLFIKIFHRRFLNAKYTFLEFPLDKSMLSAVIQKYSWTKLIFFPHSPHIYAEDVDLLNSSSRQEQKQLTGNVGYIFGFEADYEFLKTQGWSAIEGATINYLGHGVYNKKWSFCNEIIVERQNNNMPLKKKLNVVVLSRGYGSFLDFEEQKYLCSSTFEVLRKYADVACVKIKMHPREIDNTYWNYLDKKYFEIVHENVSTLVSEADLVIGFWSSAAMDSYFFGKGCYIEFYRPSLMPLGQIETNSGYKTIYNLLGAVHSAECLESLEILVQKFFDGELSKKQGSSAMEHIRTISGCWENDVKVLLNL